MQLNHIGKAFSSIQRDNIELNIKNQHLSTLAEMERQVSEVEIRQNSDLRGEVPALIVSNQELGNKLGKISDWTRMT